MAGFNTVVAAGTVSKTPELSFAKNGDAICTFEITCTQQISMEDEVKKIDTTFEVIAKNRLGETFAQYGKHGQKVLVMGSMKQVRWVESCQEHVPSVQCPHTIPRSKIRLHAQQIQFLGAEMKNPAVEMPGEDEDDKGGRSILV